METFTPEEFLTTNTEGFTKRVLHQTPAGLVFVLNFTPGQKLPPHTHEQSNLMVHVQSGSGHITIDGKAHQVGTHTVLVCKGQETFSVENTGEDVFSLLCILYPTPEDPRYAKNVR